jgi:hypothetical protein
MSSTTRALRCRLGMHRWRAVGAPDGQYLRICRSCGREEGPFPQAQDPGPRFDARDLPPGGS